MQGAAIPVDVFVYCILPHAFDSLQEGVALRLVCQSVCKRMDAWPDFWAAWIAQQEALRMREWNILCKEMQQVRSHVTMKQYLYALDRFTWAYAAMDDWTSEWHCEMNMRLKVWKRYCRGDCVFYPYLSFTCTRNHVWVCVAIDCNEATVLVHKSAADWIKYVVPVLLIQPC